MFLWLLLVLLLLLTCAQPAQQQQQQQQCETDLYRILGVSRTATSREIKSAYRKAALATHPDKQKGVPPEEAAEAFLRVVHAYEVLSNKATKRDDDRKGGGNQSSNNSGYGRTSGYRRYHDESNSRNNNNGQYQRTQGYRRVPLRDRFKVQEAMKRVLHVTSLSQLKGIMLQDEEVHTTTTTEEWEEQERTEIVHNETMTILQQILVTKVQTEIRHIQHHTVDRHLLMAFVPMNDDLESILDDDLVFPYPFAALSQQGVWWDNIVQAVKVRFQDQTKLTSYFQIPSDPSTPVFIFCKKGHTLDDYTRLETHRRDKFTSWVWEQLKVDIDFVNTHSKPIDIWWVDDDRQRHQSTLQSHRQTSFNVRLSHTFWFRDARVNQHLSEGERKERPPLSENSTLQVFSAISDDPGQLITVEAGSCFDLDTSCEMWAKATDKCSATDAHSLSFMRQNCRKTCGYCSISDDIAARKEAKMCKDRDEHCNSWAETGQCERKDYEDYMRLKCPKSCKYCVKDDDINGKDADS